MRGSFCAECESYGSWERIPDRRSRVTKTLRGRCACWLEKWHGCRGGDWHEEVSDLAGARSHRPYSCFNYWAEKPVKGSEHRGCKIQLKV